MKQLYFVFPLLSLLALAGCTPHVNLNAPSGSRPPNAHEEFYTAVAADFHDSKMCEKISDRALDERGPDMGSTDWRVSSQRSTCYFYVALATKDEDFCKLVRGIVTLPSNHSRISRSKCEEIIRKRQQFGYHPGTDDSALPGLMQEMGYGDEERYESQYRESAFNNPVYRFYAKVRNNDDFKAKIRALPSHAEAYSSGNLRPANEDEMLAQMMAVDDKLPALCGKVSPNSYAETQPHLYSETVYRVAIRNSCFSAIALNTHVPALCANIIPTENNMTGISDINRKDCEAGIRAFIRGNDTRKHYDPQYFDKYSDFVHALQKLGYEKPFLLDENTPDWRAFYLHLVFHARDAEKQEFLKRAEALPSLKN
jgi:hypothetical protein